MPPTDHDEYQLQSLSRAFDLLYCFTLESQEWGVSELAVKLNMKKSAVHRVLATFLEHEFVRQNEQHRYLLGPKLLRLSEVYRSRIDLLAFARPVLQELSESTGKTCHIAKLHQTEVIYLASARPRHQTPFTTFPTLCAPAYCTALGKVLLAYLPALEQDRIVRRIDFEKRTPHTVTGMKRFKAHLREVRGQGYAIDHEEGMLNLRCVAAPVFDSEGDVEAAVSLAGHASDLNHEILRIYIDRVKTAAEAISAKMGYRSGTGRDDTGQDDLSGRL